MRRLPRFAALLAAVLALALAAPPAFASSAASQALARALTARAGRAGSLARARALLRRALRLGRGSRAGTEAALALGSLDYGAGHCAGALAALERARAWPRPGELDAEWLYWRGQAHLGLRQWAPAARDFRLLRERRPDSPRVDAATLGEADALAALDQDARARALYRGLAGSGSAFTAQSLWGLGSLDERAGDEAAAQAEYRRLLANYPASFEAQAVPTAPPSPLPGVAPSGSPSSGAGFAVPPTSPAPWNIQVGAFSQLRWARDLVRQLRARRYRVQVLRRQIAGRRLILVQVGPYPTQADALAAARLLSTRDRLPFILVPE